MIKRYDPAVVEQFEKDADPAIARVVRSLVAQGKVGYRFESDGEGGFRLRYFVLPESTVTEHAEETA